jgi:hypothetical protein
MFLCKIVRYTKSSKEMLTMRKTEIRKKLENTLHRRLPECTWQRLDDLGLVDDLEGQKSGKAWEDLKYQAAYELDYLHSYEQEKTGEPEPERPGPEPEKPVAEVISQRTQARARAIREYAALRAGPESAEAVSLFRTKVRPEGGWDGTPPRWVFDLEVELWVPAPEIEKVYRHYQDEFLAQNTKTKERAFEAAAFVWRHEGRQWPLLWEMWNTEHLDKHFPNWRTFREYALALRGQRVALPRYKHLRPPRDRDTYLRERKEARERKERLLAALKAHGKKTNGVY